MTNNNTAKEEADLYDDLDMNIKIITEEEEVEKTPMKPSPMTRRASSGSSSVSSSNAAMRVNRTVSRRASMSSMGEDGLRARIRELEEENSTLKRNISTLYRTAREEIKRKDAQIAALQEDELDSGFSKRSD
uniref:Uncharacterized protein n=1 Tax=Leptocylindrus danicus TaxID=163516 RepID=A0A7S2JTX9_9STRA|mmetsp:Transcript_10840/g.16324  ORF Transcript_10840/g.16324 Transcript_10840/m.16324 type:complete len:132 (+) Transcript_10840:204-599(+)|eukprot:CAMPEP_0116026332 /NCGR_PEP_ID=MMETSP0321-20121206/13756_1 /TAXON_ID=163516 /ORGANISM="Leptocylindrus danicus var. danicus, Strain B650" /LENGTH=131 /DNA_ID=CAMNT_0003499047 /DNA_START=173 /DNA_END=568 /DNA_ORIENTATION=+